MRTIWCALACALPLMPLGTLEAQRLTLVQQLPAAETATCRSDLRPPTAPTAPASAAEARRLADAAALSAVAGELRVARDQLERAARLDSSSSAIAFQLARTYDALDEPERAVAAYCRVRVLDATGGDRADAEARLRELAESRGRVPQDDAMEQFQRGLLHAQAGNLAAAEQAFGVATVRSPNFPEAYYNRAVVRIGLGATSGALADLDRYASLRPAAHRPGTFEVRQALARGRHEPGVALGLGAVVPGGGQFYTGRTLTGVAVLAATVVGAYFAMEQQTSTRTLIGIDPFGTEYPYTVRERTAPRRALGISVASAALIGGAVEAFLHARRGREEVEALQARVRADLRSVPPVGAAPP